MWKLDGPAAYLRALDGTRQRSFMTGLHARVKSGLSSLLMTEAWRLALLSRSIEDSERDIDWPQPRQHENLGHAAAAVVMASAAVEAAVNEVYLAAVDRNYTGFPLLSSEQVDLLAEVWDIVESSRAKPLKKHAVALAAVGRPAIPMGEEPGQSAAALFELRNLLVHFTPEWDDGLNRHAKLEQRLAGKFEPNQLSASARGRMLWFPGRCLGAGCAFWACRTAYSYHQTFAELLGISMRLPPDDRSP